MPVAPLSPETFNKLAQRPPAAATGVLVVDVQDRLLAVMPENDRNRAMKAIDGLLVLAREMSLPVLVTEQYPKGLGPTASPIKDRVWSSMSAESVQPGNPAGAISIEDGSPLSPFPPLEKITFACTDDPGFSAALKNINRRRWIVVGLETHICVFQTVRGLVQAGHEVVVPADAVMSRDPENRRVGLNLIETVGGLVSTSETICFDMLEKAGTPAFKAVSRALV